MGIIGFDEAQAIVATLSSLARIETVPIGAAHGRILADDIIAEFNSPAAPLSAMDGYAVRDVDCAPGAVLKVVGEAAAGGAPCSAIGPGEAVRIFTGAVLSEEADRVIIQEEVTREGDEITLGETYGPASHVRALGSDFKVGDILLSKGTRLSSRAMVALAGADISAAKVFAKLRAALISTGDELAEPGEARHRANAIPESVSYGVTAMLEEAGAEVVLRARGADDLEGLKARAAVAAEAADIIIIMGGASVGDRDYAKAMFEDLAPELLIEKVAIKPGKPVWLARLGSGKYVLGLPGNPTSAMVTARLFLLPLLARLGGANDAGLAWMELPLSSALSSVGGRETFTRAAWKSDGQDQGLAPLKDQQSGGQIALQFADYLIRCPANSAAREAGEKVMALLF